MSTTTFRRGLSTVNDALIAGGVLAPYTTGSAAALIFGADSGGIVVSGANPWRSLIHFDVSGLPAGAVISSAVLTLKTNVNNLGSANYACSRVLQPNWSESSVSWNEYSDGNPWNVPGLGAGDYTDTNRDTFHATDAAADIVFANLGVLAQDALTNRAGQLHLLIRNLDESQTFDVAIMWSSEADTDPDNPQPATSFPTLVVTYTATPVRCGRSTIELGVAANL